MSKKGYIYSWEVWMLKSRKGGMKALGKTTGNVRKTLEKREKNGLPRKI
jgi:hypothetical protein